jgi:hypothetical protein
MMPGIQINILLCKMEGGKTERGVSGREGEREREKLIKGVRDRMQGTILNGVG